MRNGSGRGSNADRDGDQPMRVTIKSIARDLGLSHMTVSRALSGHGNVHPDTRDKVLARAREVGYVRSSAANAMRGDPTGIVGLLLPNIVNEFYARFANTLALLCADRTSHRDAACRDRSLRVEQKSVHHIVK